jgi:trimeric autotransporter adhesin
LQSITRLGNNQLLIQNNGWTALGTTSGLLTPTADLQVVEEGLVNPTLIIDGTSSNSTTKPSFQFMRARGTHAAPAAIQNNDWLGQFQLNGYNGSAYDGARRVFQVEASENWTPTNGGYRFAFYTRQNGTVGAPTARMTIDNTGYVGIGTTTPAQALEVNGAVQVDGAVQINTTATQPACNASLRGSFWVTQGTTSDSVSVCVLLNSAYTWKALF